MLEGGKTLQNDNVGGLEICSTHKECVLAAKGTIWKQGAILACSLEKVVAGVLGQVEAGFTLPNLHHLAVTSKAISGGDIQGLARYQAGCRPDKRQSGRRCWRLCLC